MRRRLAAFATTLSLLLGLGVLTAPSAAADQAADDVAVRIDAERAAVGLAPLVRDPALDAAALAWAQHLGASSFEHSTNAWRQSVARPGWSECCAENIAAGYGSGQAVMAGWMASSGHRANILGAATNLGVAHIVVPGSRYGDYWVQIFASYPFDRPTHEAFVRAAYRDVLGRAATDVDVRYWTDRMAAGASRDWVASVLATSPEWVTTVVTGYYRDTLGREPEPTGLTYWTAALRAGRPVAQVAASFYGSPEYVARVAHGDVRGWVGDLYRTLLGREPDSGGIAYWSGLVARGTATAEVALGFYQSDESCRSRVAALYRALLGREPDPVGLTSWPTVVRAQGDLVLAASLISSAEYLQRAGR